MIWRTGCDVLPRTRCGHGLAGYLTSIAKRLDAAQRDEHVGTVPSMLRASGPIWYAANAGAGLSDRAFVMRPARVDPSLYCVE